MEAAYLMNFCTAFIVLGSASQGEWKYIGVGARFPA